MSKYMKDPEYLFTILAALVKKNDGIIRLTEDEIEAVTKKDLIGMYYEPENKAVVFKQVDKKDILRAKAIVNENPNEQYDN
tara:strand:- start:9103 stop:9345 length:243 start_codon:yes stop_codon:yes gene_type:complete